MPTEGTALTVHLQGPCEIRVERRAFVRREAAKGKKAESHLSEEADG